MARAGVSGPAWIKVWLPGLLAGREEAMVRVAPVTHSGELLGLIVVERPADMPSFDASEENTLAELSRQVGLTLHNVRLDSAQLTMVPKTTIEVEDEAAARKILRLMDALEENDDVQDVYANFDIPERVLETVAS